MADKTRANWDHIEIDFRHDADLAALFVALDPPPDVVEAMHQGWHEMPDDLKRRLLAWGWGPDSPYWYGDSDRLHSIGVWGDWTWLEDDERFMPIIAPFVVDGSEAVFHVEDGWQYEGWYFKGGEVARAKAEQIVLWERA